MWGDWCPLAETEGTEKESRHMGVRHASFSTSWTLWNYSAESFFAGAEVDVKGNSCLGGVGVWVGLPKDMKKPVEENDVGPMTVALTSPPTFDGYTIFDKNKLLIYLKSDV